MNTAGTAQRAIPPSTNTDPPSRDVALRGASLAFNNQKTGNGKPRPAPPSGTAPDPLRQNGALLAATSASRGASHSRSLSPSHTGRSQSRGSHGLSRQPTGGSVQDTGGRDLQHAAVSRRLSYLGSPVGLTSPYLFPPGSRPGPDSRSASFIAATLAASRSASPGISPNHTGNGHGSGRAPSPAAAPDRGRRRLESPNRSIVDSVASSPDLPDRTGIPSTGSLISLFEGKGDLEPLKRATSPSKKRPKLRAPTPPRTVSPRPREKPPADRQTEARPVVVVSKLRLEPPQLFDGPPSQDEFRRDSGRVESSPARPGPGHRLRPPAAPTTPIRPVADAASGARLSRHATSPAVAGTSPAVPVRTTGGPPASGHRASTAASESSNDSFVSASSTLPPQWSSPPLRHLPKPHQPPARPTITQRPHSSLGLPRSPSAPSLPLRSVLGKGSSSTLPLDYTVDAIVAGTLASERHPATGLKPPPPVPPSRRHHHTGASHETGHGRSPKRSGMLQTLRSHPRSDDEDARRHKDRHKKPLVSGKHKHHEGARRRWREEITARERRRYEALWASNRGQFSDSASADAEDSVSNVVVRDLWSRSRLPFDELAEVWDLVDHRGEGRLSKAEFVVGMWLVDQRLRGRKIPTRVSDSVWGSAKGIKFVGPGKGG